MSSNDISRYQDQTQYLLKTCNVQTYLVNMKIICAGFPKTGTKSMANALASLGYSVHDFEEHLEYNLDNHLDFFEDRVPRC